MAVGMGGQRLRASRWYASRCRRSRYWVWGQKKLILQSGYTANGCQQGVQYASIV